MNEAQKPPTIGEELAKALVNAPKYLLEWTLGLVIVLVSETLVTTIAVTGVAVGFATGSVLIGVASFFVIYSLARMVHMVCITVSSSARGLGGAIFQAGQTRTLPPTPIPVDIDRMYADPAVGVPTQVLPVPEQ